MMEVLLDITVGGFDFWDGKPHLSKKTELIGGENQSFDDEVQRTTLRPNMPVSLGASKTQTAQLLKMICKLLVQ